MTRLLSILCLSTIAIAAPSQPKHHKPPGYGGGSGGLPSVSIKNGTVTGVHNANYNQDFFLGVPYAQPPVGENRFRNPQSINSTFASAIAANAYAPLCVGYGGDDLGYEASEDCLYLNVVRPAGYEKESLPVGVWIHGGGLYMGGSADKRYNLSFIVENSVAIGKPIIGVSIGYRLSGWGFLASQEVVGAGQTNIGFRDQRLALHWLQENIAPFGGDKEKVTIWGESAGGLSVGMQLMAYNGRDDKLFRGGIMESGTAINYNSFRAYSIYQPLYDNLVNSTGCYNAIDTLECLRTVPYAEINAIFNTTTYRSGFLPIVDGDFIARYTSEQLADGSFVHVPIIDGTNTDEGVAFGPQGVNSTAVFVADVTRNTTQAYIGPQFAQGVLDAYPKVCGEYYVPGPEEVPCDFVYPASYGDSAEYRRSAAYIGDVVMSANRRAVVTGWAAHGVPAYSYRFNTLPAGLPYYVGVVHFQEVAWVFDNVNGLGYDALHGTINPFTNASASYLALGKLMSESWASFIYDLDPNYVKTRPADTAQWPVYSVSAPQNIVFDGNRTDLAYAEPDTYRKAGMEFINSHALAYHR